MDYTGKVERYIRSQFDFDNTDTMAVMGPKGKRGLLMDYGIYDVTETFAGTTKPTLTVGDGSTANKYGTAFSLTSVASDGGMSIRQTYVPGTTAWNTKMAQRETTKDVAVVLTMNAGVTGPAGIATAFMDIMWET